MAKAVAPAHYDATAQRWLLRQPAGRQRPGPGRARRFGSALKRRDNPL